MVKVAINGFGRIGRNALKILLERRDAQVVAINDITDANTLAHLLKHDSSYGAYDKKVSAKENALVINSREIPVFAEKDPAGEKGEEPAPDAGCQVSLLKPELPGSEKSRQSEGRKREPVVDKDLDRSQNIGAQKELQDSVCKSRGDPDDRAEEIPRQDRKER